MESTSAISLKPDGKAVLRCFGRIQDYNPIFIPRRGELAILLVKHYHKKTLHGGVSLTMNSFRERFWTPKLRSIVKGVIHKCEKWKRYRVKQVASPPSAKLPEFRVRMTDPFNVTGVDFAGPMTNKIKKRHLGKAYVALFTCTSTSSGGNYGGFAMSSENSGFRRIIDNRLTCRNYSKNSFCKGILS